MAGDPRLGTRGADGRGGIRKCFQRCLGIVDSMLLARWRRKEGLASRPGKRGLSQQYRGDGSPFGGLATPCALAMIPESQSPYL